MTRAGGRDVANIFSAYEIHFKIKVEEVNGKRFYLFASKMYLVVA